MNPSLGPIRRLVWVAIGLLLLFNLATLGRVPEIPHGDDGAYGAAAYQFWQTGHPGVPGYRDILGLGQDIFVFGRTAAAFQGVFMWFLGVNLFMGLLPSFLAGLWLLTATYCLGRSLWGNDSALLAATILGSSGIFFLACHSARPDLLLACYWVTALYLLASAPPGHWSWRYLIAGLLMGLSGDVHLNGFLLAPIPLIFWFVLRRESFRLRIRISLTYIGAGLMGVGGWLALHYWPNREAFIPQIMLFGASTHGIRVWNLGFFGALLAEAQRYLSWFWDARFHRHFGEGLMILGCMAWMIWKGGQRERAAISAWLTLFGVAVLFMTNPFGCYLIYAWPLFALWMARGFFKVYQSLGRRWAAGAFLILFTGYFLNLALWTGKAVQGPSYDEISRELLSTIPPQASVVASAEWWFTFWDRDFTDAQYMYFQNLALNILESKRSPGWEQGWKQLRWQFAVANRDIQSLLDPKVPLHEAIILMGVSRTEEILEARSFSRRHCRVWQKISTDSTPILIFKIE